MKKGRWITLLFLIGIAACTKVERSASKFMKAGTWNITSIQLGYDSSPALPEWQISSCGDPESYCEGTWQHQNGNSASFFWLFDKAGTAFSFYADPDDEKMETNKAWLQSTNLAGTYKVVEHTNNYLEITSMETYGYPGSEVVIKATKE